MSISPQQAVAREAARLRTGRFGVRPLSEGDVVLVTRPKVVRVVSHTTARTGEQIEQDMLRDARHRARHALGGRVETELDPLALRPGDEIVDTYGDPHEITEPPQRHPDGTITTGRFTFAGGESASVRHLAGDTPDL